MGSATRSGPQVPRATATSRWRRGCSAVFDALQPAGVRYLVIVLDELETAAERAASGMEVEESRAMEVEPSPC